MGKHGRLTAHSELPAQGQDLHKFTHFCQKSLLFSFCENTFGVYPSCEIGKWLISDAAVDAAMKHILPSMMREEFMHRHALRQGEIIVHVLLTKAPYTTISTAIKSAEYREKICT